MLSLAVIVDTYTTILSDMLFSFDPVDTTRVQLHSLTSKTLLQKQILLFYHSYNIVILMYFGAILDISEQHVIQTLNSLVTANPESTLNFAPIYQSSCFYAACNDPFANRPDYYCVNFFPVLSHSSGTAESCCQHIQNSVEIVQHLLFGTSLLLVSFSIICR